jgi:hypothetical protein
MRRVAKRLLRLAKIAALIMCCVTLIPVVVALGRAAVECRAFGGGPRAQPSQAENAGTRAITAGLKGYARPEDQTYLTLPEWYIVYSADEYAAFVAHDSPSHFAYFQAIGQFWQNYYNVCAVTRDRYPFNSGYHLSLAVIGSSFTVENIVKGLYENTVGRFSEWTSGGAPTEEDIYARAVAAEYGTFLHTIPWYEFPFRAKLDGLWHDTPLWGAHPIRKWERRLALSLEYGIKALYGWVIKQGTQGVYSAEDLEIQLWAEGVSDAVLKQTPQLRVAKPIDASAAIVVLPRYEAFTQVVPQLARQGVRFVEIAGNDEILVTLIAPRDWAYNLEDGKALFALPIPTQPSRARVAVQVPVAALDRLLRALDGQDVVLEHIYDY